MPTESRESTQAYAKAVVRQYNEVARLISTGLDNEIPQEVGIELQHMLMHMVAAEAQSSDNHEAKTRELANALGHADRAFLDGCKILVHQRFPDLQANFSFMQDWAAVRQGELQSHSRRTPRGSRGETIPEQTNLLCARFKGLLRHHNLLPPAPQGPGTIQPLSEEGTLRRWKDFLPSVKCWLRLDLFYSTLRGEKHHPALRFMLLSFMKLDKRRLARMNLQIMLDTLAYCGDLAYEIGWHGFTDLSSYFPFIESYMGTTTERDLTEHQNWIYPLFADLWKFYLPDEKPPNWQAPTASTSLPTGAGNAAGRPLRR